MTDAEDPEGLRRQSQSIRCLESVRHDPEVCGVGITYQSEVGMCYASAEGRSRDARQDEVLVVRKQPYGTNWLVSPEDASTAVCLRTGTAVELLYVPKETQRRFGTQEEALATFKMDDWWRRDVFLLRNGRKVLLRKLQDGQVVRVLSVQVTGDRTPFNLVEEEQTTAQSEMPRLP